MVTTVLALAVGACNRPALAPADATYTTRGQVVEVPRTADGELSVHHEEVPSFRDREGKPSHMDSMTMPFAVAPDVSLAAVAPGDKVEITFDVRWESDPSLLVVKLQELPETTALKLGGPTFELVAPLGSGAGPKPTPTPAPQATPGDRPATDGPSARPSETI